MVGLDAAGKTTILYKLKLGEVARLLVISIDGSDRDVLRSTVLSDS